MFHLVRHASHDQLGRVLSGWTPGVHLNDTGRRELEWLVDRLSASRAEVVVTSPLERCRETAAPIADSIPCELVENPDLGEIQYGDWTGLRFAELESQPRWHEFNRHRSRVRIPGGESMADVQRRVVRSLETLQGRHRWGPVIVVSHGDVLRTAIAYFLGLSLDALDRFEIAPGSVSTVSFEHDGPRVLSLNEMPRPRRASTQDAAVLPEAGRRASAGAAR
jgi:probable phosphoglycerate mutase